MINREKTNWISRETRHLISFSEWLVVGLVGAVGLLGLVAIAAMLAMRKRRQYPSLLLPPKQVIAVRNGFPTGPCGLKQSPSPLQSPLSTDSRYQSPVSPPYPVSSPSPTVPFNSLLEERTRKLSPSELPAKRGFITFSMSYDPVSLALQVALSSNPRSNSFRSM